MTGEEGRVIAPGAREREREGGREKGGVVLLCVWWWVERWWTRGANERRG